MRKKLIPRLWIVFGISSSFILIIAIVLFAVFDISKDKRYFEKANEIVNKFSPWCKSERYICYESDIHYLTLLNDNIDLDKGLENSILHNNKDIRAISLQKYVLYIDNCFYFCGVEDILDSNYDRLVIYKTGFNDFSTQRVAVIGGECTIKSYRDYDCAFGYSTEGYFRVGDMFYEFNFLEETLTTIEKSDKRTLCCTFDNYLNSCQISITDCKEKTENIIYSYQNVEYTFEKSQIDDEKCQLIESYGFKPVSCISLNNDITSIIYYDTSKTYGYGNCLMLTYSRVDNKIIDYQIFIKINLSKRITAFFPKIA